MRVYIRIYVRPCLNRFEYIKRHSSAGRWIMFRVASISLARHACFVGGMCPIRAAQLPSDRAVES